MLIFSYLDSLKSTITIAASKASEKRAETPKAEETSKTPEPTKANNTVPPTKISPKKVTIQLRPAEATKPAAEKPTATSTAQSTHSSNDENTVPVNGDATNNNTTPSLNVSRNSKGILPKAMIKPHVLTHVIAGHVIQEGNEPFPVTRQRYSEDSEEPQEKRRKTSSPEKASTPDRCGQCGKKDIKNKYKPYCSKQCSKSAAKAGAIPTAQQNGTHKLRIRNENGTTNGSVSPKSLPSPTSSSTSTNGMNSDSGSNGSLEVNGKKAAEPTPMETDADMEQDESFLCKWSVDEVCDFIRSLAGYSEFADDFFNHEIDGQALVLLNENHLVNTLKIKLGPALKIMSQIEAIKKKGAPQTEQQSQWEQHEIVILSDSSYNVRNV